MNTLTPAQRLIVAADFKVEATGRGGLVRKVRSLAQDLVGTGCTIKLNSLLRAHGYNLIDELRSQGFGFFADLKLIDIGETLENDGALLRAWRPNFVTAMGFAGVESLKRLKGELPDSKVLGVTILTSLKENDTERMFGCTVRDGVLRFASIIMEAGLDGFICAPKEAGLLREEFGPDPFIASAGVRFEDQLVANDDQNQERVMSPGRTIDAGADAVVMGRPIAQNPDATPGDAARRAMAEMMDTSV